MTMVVADMQRADVDTKCPNLSLPTSRTREDHTLQTNSGQLAHVPTTVLFFSNGTKIADLVRHSPKGNDEWNRQKK